MNSDDGEGGSVDDRIILTIKGKHYDVTEYASVHPGEGHNDIYLEDWAGKDVSKEFEYYHSKKDKPVPQEILARVDKRGKYKKITLVHQGSGNGDDDDDDDDDDDGDNGDNGAGRDENE